METYAVGAKMWRNGDELVITSEPFTLSGGEYQNGQRADGKVFVVATPRYERSRAAAKRAEHEEMQAGFRRLHNA